MIPKRDADLSLFDGEQIAHADEVMDRLCPAYAKEISKATHQHLGWRLAEYRKETPYCTVFLNDDIALPSDIERDVELAEKYGWFTDTSR